MNRQGKVGASASTSGEAQCRISLATGAVALTDRGALGSAVPAEFQLASEVARKRKKKRLHRASAGAAHTLEAFLDSWMISTRWSRRGAIAKACACWTTQHARERAAAPSNRGPLTLCISTRPPHGFHPAQIAHDRGKHCGHLRATSGTMHNA